MPGVAIAFADRPPKRMAVRIGARKPAKVSAPYRGPTLVTKSHSSLSRRRATGGGRDALGIPAHSVQPASG